MKTLTKPTTPPSLSAGPVNNLVGMRRDPLEFLSRAQQEYGDVIQLKIATRQVYMLSHPDFIRDVLVTNNRKFVKGRGVERLKRMLGEGLITSEGEFHLRQRR